MKNTGKLISLNLALFLLLSMLPLNALAAITGVEFPVELTRSSTDVVTFTVTSSGTYTFQMKTKGGFASCGYLALYDSNNVERAETVITGNFSSYSRECTFVLEPGEYTVQRYPHPQWWGFAQVVELTLLDEAPKYPVTVSLTPPADITYGEVLDTPNATQVAIANGTDAAGTFSFSYTGTIRSGEAYSSNTAPTEAGTYTVTATLDSATHSGSASAAFTISPKPLSDDMLTISGDYAYTGQAITPTYEMTDGSTAISASHYQIAATDNVDAGTATLTVTAADTGNYSGTAVQSFSIAKQTAPTVEVITRAHTVAAISPGNIDLTGYLPADRGTTTFSIVGSSTGGAVANSAVDPATGTFTYETTDSPTEQDTTVTISAEMQNYETAAISVSIVLQSKLVPGGTPVIGSGIHYGQTLSALSIAVSMSVGGTPVSGTIAWELPDSIPSVATTSATWVFTPADSATYAIATGSSPIVVNRTTPTGTPTYSTITATGKTLSVAAIQGVFKNPYTGLAVPGDLTWNDGADQAVAANTAYGWTFTPADSANYNAVTGTITPYVVLIGGGEGGPAYYTITFDTNGGSEIAKQSVSAGGTVQKPADPTHELFIFSGWFLDEDCTEPYDFETKITKSMTLYAGWEEAPVPPAAPILDLFDDDNGHWAEHFINSLGGLGYVSGVGNRKYAPDAPLARVQFVQMLYNVWGNGDTSSPADPFDDTDSGAWYEKALNWAFAKGLIEGYSATAFGPEDPLTREQMAVLIVRAAEQFEVALPDANEKTVFADDSDIAGWAYDEVYAMQQAGILEGKPGNLFDPQGELTRSEMAKVIYYVLELAGLIADEY